MPRISWQVVFVALFLPQLAAGQGPAAPSKEQVAQALRDLGSPRFQVREKASALLWSAGKAGELALCGVLENTELEVVRRARALLEKFKWGIYPDTPKDALALIAQYRSATAEARATLLKNLFNRGEGSYRVLARLLSAEGDATIRRQAFPTLTAPAIPDLLRRRRHDLLEDVLTIRLASDDEAAVRDYAVFLFLSGRLEGVLPYYRAWAGPLGDERAKKILPYLYRVKGDLTAARAAAERGGDLTLFQSILYLQGDWKELSARHEKLVGQDAQPGFKAAYHRLAGRTEAFEQAVAELQRLARNKSDDAGTFWGEAKALFLNDRPREALALLNQGREHRLEFDILCAQMKYREALAVLERTVAKYPKHALQPELRRAKLLHRLGEKERALEVLAKAEKQLTAVPDADEQANLLETLWQMGLRERALRHCAVLLDGEPPPTFKASPDHFASSQLARLFPNHEGRLPSCWKIVRLTRPEESTLRGLQRLRDLLEGKVKGAELAALVHAGDRAARKLFPQEREEWLNALAAVSTDRGRPDLARHCLESAAASVGSSATLLKLGNFLLGQKLWQDAAAVLDRAYEQYSDDAVFCYLSGWLLARHGRAAEGKARMELAHWLPLGDDNRRHALALALGERGLRAEAQREFELVLRSGQPHSWYAGDTWRQLAKAAVEEKNYLEAAARWERFYLPVMREGTSFLEDEAYVQVPHQKHLMRARGLLAAGDAEGAWKEIQFCLTLLPGEPETPILFVPLLTRRGEKRRAEELFAQVYGLYERHCKEYPRDAGGHNGLAWLAARCRRRLNEALGHAREAVRLAPDSAGYLDTLAEVQFQRGEQAEALRLMRRCVELAPGRDYYRRQLKRFEAADPKAEVVE